MSNCYLKLRKCIDIPLARLSSEEKQFYELRESYSIDFNFSYLGNINSDCLLYFVAAFGTEENYEKFITLSSLQADVDSQRYHRLAIYIALKYRNMNLITYFLRYMKIYVKDDVDQNLLSTMLGFAAEFGYVHIVREIMEDCNKCNPAFEDNYAIKDAASKGHLHVVKIQSMALIQQQMVIRPFEMPHGEDVYMW